MFFSWIKRFQSTFFVWMLCCHFTNLNFSAHCLHKLVTHEHCFLPSFLFLYRNTVQHAHSEIVRMQKSVRHVRISLCPNVRIQRMYIKKRMRDLKIFSLWAYFVTCVFAMCVLHCMFMKISTMFWPLISFTWGFQSWLCQAGVVS